MRAWRSRRFLEVEVNVLPGDPADRLSDLRLEHVVLREVPDGDADPLLHRPPAGIA